VGIFGIAIADKEGPELTSAAGCKPPAMVAAPQFGQNLSPACISQPHPIQRGEPEALVPHSVQKRSPGFRPLSHFAHR
jgi:hypothetical protein